MTDVYNDFFIRSSHDFSLWSQQNFVIPLINSILKGKNSLRYFGSVKSNSLPHETRNSETLPVFKSTIKMWNPDSCTCRLCKEYIGGVVFIIHTLILWIIF